MGTAFEEKKENWTRHGPIVRWKLDRSERPRDGVARTTRMNRIA